MNQLDTKRPESRIAIIACGVLALDYKALVPAHDAGVQMHFLPGGLHKSPALLRERLQETIDQIDRYENVTRIIIGYGLCGHGTTGLVARRIPLVIPRVHDCIALFLGSDAAYREQFTKAPGTYYLSAGWVEETDIAHLGMGSVSPAAESETDAELQDRYGNDNAAFIKGFMESWTRNYSRAAFIDTGVGGNKEKYARKAEALAKEYGWQYDRIPGTHDLLQASLTCTQSTEQILFVPPGCTTTYDALHGRLTIAETHTQGTTANQDRNPARSSLSSPEHAPPVKRGIGIGIDAGGTYTDAVLYDLDKRFVIAKHKALTTHWDYSEGIEAALAGLDPVLCKQATLVALSTTIATNAIVEHRGQAVGLLVMPPCGWSELEGFKHQPVEIIRGQLAIDGIEHEPVDVDQVRRIAQQLVEKKGVSAFAVGGYAAHVNPVHELLVKDIVQTTTGLICTCSHELSSTLHYRIRAETAALNARIIPCLEELLLRISTALDTAGIKAPVMVVRSDGSFMSLQTACERPLETMLSGPAASAAGAGWLAGVENGLVVDIGGTTTDTAILHNGQVALNPEGASIGGWQTHIRALDLQTAGLGGDSCIRIKHGTLTIGPDRVIPLSWTATHIPGATVAMERIGDSAVAHPTTPDDWIMLIRTRKQHTGTLSEKELQMLTLLNQGPMVPSELAKSIGVPHPMMLPLKALLDKRLIAYSGLTPTDALHVTGAFVRWDAEAARKAARSCAGTARQAAAWAGNVITQFENLLAREIARKTLVDTIPAMDPALLGPILAQIANPPEAGEQRPHLRLDLPWPIIGIGAPAQPFIPGACARLAAKYIIPPHADVANAVGAIIGMVSVQHILRITADENGVLRISGATDAPRFTRIEEAAEWGMQFLYRHLGERARQAGCPQPSIAVTPHDRFAPATDGSPIFIGRELHGHASGIPDTSA